MTAFTDLYRKQKWVTISMMNNNINENRRLRLLNMQYALSKSISMPRSVNS